jgi:arabinose-5-phosphate isomerase
MSESILTSAIRTIQLEAESIAGLVNFINRDFEKAINAIFNSKGRLIISGVGKSGIIAQKIVATLNSTGTPGLFMHAADAIHGDLGMIQKEDVVMLISKSGESSEVKLLVPLIKNFGNLLIGMTGNPQSSSEACPNNLAPTSSTTAQLVMGDVLAVCLMQLRGFNGNDFARIHPGGNLGKRLYLRVRDLFTSNAKPRVNPLAGLKEIIVEISAKRLGATAVISDTGKIEGIITDGDLRRMLEKNQSLDNITAAEISTINPKTVLAEELAVNALELLRINDISQLIVIDNNNNYLGILHLHDLVREGIV